CPDRSRAGASRRPRRGARRRVAAGPQGPRQARSVSRESQTMATARMSRARRGYFGAYGGQFVPETLYPALRELESAFARLRRDNDFKPDSDHLLEHYVGRPSPLYPARRLSEHHRGALIYLKREDLNHTGAHKINNCLGQALLAKRLRKRRLIAETGAGQHGV